MNPLDNIIKISQQEANQMIIEIALGIVLAVVIIRLLPLASLIFTWSLVILFIVALIVFVVYNWKVTIGITLIGLLLILLLGSFIIVFNKTFIYIDEKYQNSNQNKTKYFKALALILLVIIYPLTARGLFYFVEPFYKNLF